MVRETRHLWVGNLPDNVREDRIREHFKRCIWKPLQQKSICSYGRVQSVKLLSRGSSKEPPGMGTESNSGVGGGGGSVCGPCSVVGSGGLACTVAFMDIKSAAKAHTAEHKLDERTLTTEYYEPVAITSPAASPPPGPPVSVVSVQSGNSNAGSLQQTQAQTQQRFNNSHSVHHERPNEEHSFFYDRLGASGVSNISSVGGDYLRRGPVNSVVSGYLDSSNGAGTRGRARDRLYRGTTGGNGATYTLDRPSRAWGYDPPLPQTPPNTRYTSGPLSTLSPVYGSGQKKATSAKSRSGSESPVSPCDRSVSRSSESRSRSSSPSTSSGSRLTVTDSPAPQRRPLAVCVRNLPTRSSDTSLKDGLFHEYKKHGKVTWVKVVGQSADRYAVVCFKRPEDAEKALEASYDKLFFGCKIDVAPHQGYTSTNDIEGEPPRPYEAELDEFHPKATRTLFVGNLDKDVTSVELRKHFEPFGRILEIDVKKQGAAGSYAFCQFADITSVVRAIRGMDGEHIGTVRVKLGFGKSMPSNCVWVDGIVDSVNEKHLTGHFHQFGPITQVSIDRSRGQALVFFEQAAFAQAAVKEMRGIQLRGRRLQVDFASRECQDVFYESVEKQVNSVYDTSPVSRFRYDAIPRTRTSSYTRQNSACSNIRPTTRYSDYYEYEQDCGSSPSEDAVRKRSRGESDHNESITTITNSDCRTGRRRSSCASRSAATCKRRKASREAASENDSDGSRPGTPLCDERPEAQPPSEPRRVAPPRSGHDPPLSLPLPKFAAQFRAGPQVVPPPVHEPPPASPPPFKGASRPPSREHSRDGTKEVTRNSKDFHISCPVRESVRDCVKDVKTQSRPPSRAPSDSSDSDVPPASPSLEERIRSLDEKYEKWSGSRVLMAGASDTLAKIDAAVSERFRFRHKLLDLDLRELPPSEIVKSVLAKRSVFDEDSKRLENFGEKYEPSATQLRSLPGSGPKLPPAKGLQYPFPSHPPTTPPSGLPPPVSPLMSSVKIIMPTKPVGSVTTTALTAQVKLSAVPVLSVSSSSVKTTSPTQTLISLTSTTLTKSSVTTVSTSTIVKTTVSSVLSVPITSTIPSKPATSAIPTVKLIASVTHCASNLIKPVIHTQPTTSTNPTTTLPSHAPRISSIQTDHACKVTVKNDKVLKEPVVVLLNSARKEHRSSKCERDADNVECDKKKDSDVCDKKVEVKEDKEEQLEKERLEKERLQEERLEEEKLEKERIEKAEKERLENEKAEKEKQERLAKEHEDKELRDKEEKESEKREQLEREKQEKQKQIKEEEQLQKEREECLEREYVEKECLLKEKIEKPEKVEETHEKGHKEDSHELKKDIIKHKENNTLDEFKIRRDSYTDARTNERCKENFDTSKSHQDTVKKEYESKNHEISRTNHDRRDDQHNYKERYHSEKDESPLKLKELSIKKEKENRDLNYHDKKYSESTKHGEPKHIENRHSSLDNDKSRQYSEHNTNLSTNPLKEKKKERSNSSPVSIGIKRHIGSQDGLDSLIEDSKRIKLDHKKILDRRNSKDKSKHMRHKSVDEKVKDEKRIKDSGDERRRDEREQDKHKLKQKSEKHKSKNKDKLIQSPTICKMPNKELTLDKDFLARLELRTNEEMEEKRIKKEKRSKLDEERKNSLDEKYEEKKKEKHERKPSRDESVTSSKSDDRKSKKEDKRKMTNSSDTTDSDEPKKHSIFDIVDDEPAYISMYDKVKARSCKNMQKQEEEKRQEKIKAKFSQLKQSRAKREEKKRSTSWEEDSDSDHSGHERPGSKQGSNRRGNKMLITSSSEDESGMKKPRKIRTDYTDSEKSERHTSDDEHRLKSLTRKGSKSRITSDSEDEKPKIKLEIFSDHEFDERYKKQIEIKDERIDISFDQDNKYIKKSPNKNMMHVSDDEMRKILSENIKMEVYDVDEIKQENNKFNNRSLICDASSESEIYITDKKNGFSDKTESRKKHKKKQKRQKNISIDDDNHHTDDVETTEREDSFHEIKISMERKKHSKKEKKRDKVKDECGERVRDRTKKSKKTFKPELGLKSEIASSVKHDDKMQDIFGPFSDDSEIGYSTKEIIPNNGNNKPVDSFFDRYTSKLQVSVIYGSDSDSMSNIEAVQSSVFNEKDEKEDCKQRKEKKKKDKIICEENENSVDLVEAGRALEAKLLDVSNEELKIDDLNTKTDLSDETKTETIESDVFKFTDGDDSPETDKKEIERKDSKEKKKKRKKSKDEKHNRKEHHHHHYHHDVEDKKVITETDTKVSKKDTTIEEKLPMQSPSLPSIIDICSPPKSNSDVQNLPNLSGLPTPSLEVNSDISVDKNDLSTVKSPNSKETLLNQISKTPTSEKKKFIPGFGTEIDEKIHESAVKSISDFGSSPVTLEEEVPAPDESKIDKNIESVDDKPRVVISQEETEDAVAALLGESFGGTESEFDSYNTVESPSNENPSESAIPEDDEEMRQAVQSLNASDTETKPDTPQSEHDLQIDTDTEGEEISTTSYDQLPKTPDFTQPPKTPDVPTHYYDNIPVKSMETPVAISTIKTPPIHNVDKPVAITEVPKDVVCRSIEPDLKEKRELPLPPLAKIEDNNSEKTPKSVITSGWSTEPKQVDNIKDKLLVSVPATVKVPTIVTKPSITLQNKQYLTPPTINIPDSNLYSKSPILSPENISKLPPKISMPILTTVNSQIQIRNIPIRIQPPARILSPIVTNPSPLSRLPVPVPIVKQNVILPPSKLPTSTENSCLPKLETPVRLAFSTANVPLRLPHSPVTPTLSSASPPRSMPPLSSIQQMSPIIHRFVNLTPIIKEPPSKSNVAVVEPSVPISSTVSVMTSAVRSIKTYETNIPPVEPKSVSSIIQQLPVIKTTISELPTATKVSESLPVVTTKVDLSKEETKISTPSPVIVSNPNQETVKQEINTDKDPKDLVLKEETKAENITQMQNTPVVCSAEISENKVINSLKIATEEVDLMLKKEETVKEETDKKNIIDIKEEESVVEPKIPECNEITAEPSLLKTEPSESVKELDDDKMEDAESGISDMSKDTMRLSADILENKDDPLDSKDDSYYWSKEVNIDYVIKKVDAICSADELSEESEIEKDEWFDSENKLPETESKSSISLSDISPNKSLISDVSKPITTIVNTMIEYETDPPKTFNEMTETVEDKGSTRGSKRGGRLRGRKNQSNQSLGRGGVQTRRGRKDSPRLRGIIQNRGAGRVGRVDRNKKKTDSELSSDVYEFRDDSDENKDRPRLIFTIKSPATNIAVKDSTPTKEIIPAKVDARTDFASPATNTRKSKRLQERDVSRNTVDEIIEDVVRNKAVVTRSASAALAKRTRQTKSNVSTETRKSPRGNRKGKDQRVSETNDDFSDEKVLKKTETSVDLEVKPETNILNKVIEKSTDKEMVQPTKSETSIVPQHGLKAAVLRRLKGETEEPQTLIDPVTGVLMIMKESEEGQYIPISTATISAESTSIITTRPLLEPTVNKVEISLPRTQSQPNLSTVLTSSIDTLSTITTPAQQIQTKPHTLKAHVLSSQAAKSNIVHVLSTTSSVYQQTPIIHSTVVKQAIPNKTNPQILSIHTSTANQKSNIPIHSSHLTHVANQSNILCLPTQPVVTKQSNMANIPNQSTLPNQPNVPNLPNQSSQSNLSNIPVLNQHIPISQHLNVNVSLSTTIISPNLSPRLGPKPPLHNIKSSAAQSPMSPKQHLLQAAKGTSTKSSVPIPPIPKSHLLNAAVGHINKSSVTAGGVGSMKQHGLHVQQQIMTGAVASPPPALKHHLMGQQPIVTGASSGRMQTNFKPVGATEPPKQESSCLLVPHPTISPQIQARGQIMQAGMPVPAYEANLGDSLNHLGPPLPPAHYVPTHVYQYLRPPHSYQLSRSPHMGGGIEKYGDGQEGEEAPVTSPPLELRRPGSTGASLAVGGPHRPTSATGLRTTSVPHSLQSPHERATDSPQVAQVYMHGTRGTHYGGAGGSRYFETAGDPPPAHRSYVPLGPPGPPVRHGAADAPVSQRGLLVATPPHASQVPSQVDSLHSLLSQRYPVLWQGLLALKNDQAAVQMHYVFGNPHVARDSLPCNSDGSTPPLRIAQRMRLEQTQIDGVARKMQMENEHCMLLALPCGRDCMDVLQQSTNLQNGFITYLQQKQAAGIVNIAEPGSQQAAYVVHIFPSCEFANENLARIAPDLLHRVAEITHLLIIIATV